VAKVNFPASYCGIPFAASLFDTTLRLGPWNSAHNWTISGLSGGDQPDYWELPCAFLTESQYLPSLHNRSSWLLQKTATD
jgi:hypothetical protein